MKYIDTERLKSEIRHLKIDVYDEANQFDIGARSSLTFLESFIDSLQQEMWKPSKEQMRALKVTLDYMPDVFKPRCTLMTLQNDLEKLM